MRKIKHVLQMDHCGCTIACLSMLTGESYFQIREDIHKFIPRFKTGMIQGNMVSPYTTEILDFIKAAYSLEGKFIKFNSLKKLKKHCLLTICALSGNLFSTHAVVFDATTRKIVNPTGKPLDMKTMNVMCCMEIQ